MINLLMKNNPYRIYHIDKTIDEEYKKIPDTYTSLDYVNSNIPKIKIDHDPTIEVFLQNENLSMKLNGNIAKIIYAIYKDDNNLQGEIREHISPITNNSIEICDENLSVKLYLNSSKKVTLTQYKNHWYYVLILKIMYASINEASYNNKNKKIYNPITYNKQDINFNLSTNTEFNHCYLGYLNGTPMWVFCENYAGLKWSYDATSFNNTNITSGNFNYCYYAKGIWVACSDSDGLYYTNSNMNSWTQTNVRTGRFRYCIYANNKWVACGQEVGVWYSNDGISWTRSLGLSSSATFDFCKYAQDIWLFSGVYTGDIYYSEDLENFDSANASSARYIDYNNGIWIACTSSGLYYSTDGKNWEIVYIIKDGEKYTDTSLNFYTCCYSNNLWIAGAYLEKGLYYSSDGINWINNPIALKYPLQCYYVNNLWLVKSTSGVYYSRDGIEWTQSNLTSGNFSNFYYGQNKLLTYGIDSLYYYSDEDLFKTDAYNTSYFTSCYYKNNIWVATCKYYGLYYSTDGINWNSSNITSGDFNYCYSNDNIWVACSTKGLYYSTNGKNWTQSNITTGNFDQCDYANNLWVAVGIGSNGVWYSSDGISWANCFIRDTSFSYCKYGTESWLLLNENGSSPYEWINQNNWIKISVLSSIRSLCYGKGLWVAGGHGGLWYYNENGWTTTNITTGVFTDTYYLNNLWIAIGSINSTGRGIWYSTDAINWNESNITLPIGSHILCCTYYIDKWLAIDSDYNIYYSVTGDVWQKTNNIKYCYEYYNAPTLESASFIKSFYIKNKLLIYYLDRFNNIPGLLYLNKNILPDYKEIY